ncbi:hypothetical protein MUBE_05365 [Mycobacterium uberis]|uniref:Uncharacterized protein n=1 Tax=Mycobacterium uberis TaxID=2162698 RepID=A0A3E1HJ63_9MYCO|nr:hypothetical protein [Mycobacterium uberis]RFD26339.1 hypothetical protein MUBE_05365 [Mycobacterium uberis]
MEPEGEFEIARKLAISGEDFIKVAAPGEHFDEINVLFHLVLSTLAEQHRIEAFSQPGIIGRGWEPADRDRHSSQPQYSRSNVPIV